MSVATCGVAADGFDVDFAPLFAELHPRLFTELERSGVTPAGPTYGLYEQRDDGRIDVIAGVVVPDDAHVDSNAIEIKRLPSAERAATLVHQGSMQTIIGSYALLDGWIEAAGEQARGLSREMYLECPPGDQSDWITELQFALA